LVIRFFTMWCRAALARRAPHPAELDCRYETICKSCTFFFTTLEYRPTIQAQRDDADAKGQTGRRDVYDNLLRRLDDTPA